MVKTGNWCKNLFLTLIFLWVSWLASGLELFLAIVTDWGTVMEWTMNLFYALASPDSQWETVIQQPSWLTG